MKKNGDQCGANSLSGSEYCYWHSPKIDEKEKTKSRSRGGKSNTHRVITPLEPIRLKSTHDIVILLSDTINRVRGGTMPIKIANCIGYLAGFMIKALEISELEKRLENLETTLAEKKA